MLRCFKQVEGCATMHLALDKLEPVDLAVDLAARPGCVDGGSHGRLVGAEARGGVCKLACLGGCAARAAPRCLLGAHHRVGSAPTDCARKSAGHGGLDGSTASPSRR